MCALRLAGGRDRKHEIASRDWVPPPAPGPLVPMGNLRALPAQTDAVLSLVAEPAPPGGERVVQSLYRHFLHRPAFLALAVTLLRQRIDDGSVDQASRRIQAAMALAAEMARGVVRDGRSRSEVPWESVTTVAHCRQRLAESRRMRLASLEMWPDEPYLDNKVTPWASIGEIDAYGRFILGLSHDQGHLAQIEDVIAQAKAARGA